MCSMLTISTFHVKQLGNYVWSLEMLPNISPLLILPLPLTK